MASATYRGRDYSELRDRQRRRALELYGQDEVASGIEPRGAVIPKTSAAYALDVALGWLDMAPDVIGKLAEALPDIGSGALARRITEGAVIELRLAHLANADVLDTLSQHLPLGASILRRLQRMFSAIDYGASFGGLFADDEGYPVMNPAATRQFWDSIPSSDYAGSGAVVTHSEQWTAFVKGAREGAHDVAHAAGLAAAAIARTAGELGGDVLGGFFSGLGLTTIAVVGVGGYVAWRYVL